MFPYNRNPKLRLHVNTHDEVAEIFVIDAHFHLVDRGVGRSKIFDLDPGVYTIRVRTGSQTQENYAILRPGEEGDAEPLVKDFPPLKFSSSAPLYNTAKTHEYQMSAADILSREVHVHAGQGSSIFVFVRDWTPPTRPAVPRIGSPARGLTLRNAQGNFIADFARQSVSGNGGDPWSACNVSVNPGLYRLSLETSLDAKLEQMVVASPGWQTQIFLLQRAYGESLDDRQADLPGASILLSRHGFDPTGDDMRLTELIRLGLSESRQVLSDRIVDDLLAGKFDNPMLGIYGTHLLLLNKELDSDRLRLIIANLRGLLGIQHPDVEALALKVAPDDVPHVFDYPPMLRKSWWYVLDATVRKPDLVPVSSFAANMAGQLWGDGIWLAWMTPAAGDVSGIAGSRQGAERTPQQNDTLGDFTASLLTSAPVREAIAQIQSGTQASGVRVTLDDDTARRLVYTLGIPRANVEDLLDKLNQQPTTPVPDPGFKWLFDGSNTNKWRMSTIKNQPGRDNPGRFLVVDSTLEAVPGTDIGLYWYTEPTPADFVLKLEWLSRREDDKSGVFICFPHPDSKGYNNTAFVGVDFGVEVPIDQRAAPNGATIHKTGAIYNFAEPMNPDALPVPPLGQWNTFEIWVQGQTYTVRLNGMQISRFTFTVGSDGQHPDRGLPSTTNAPRFIGLQIHTGRVAFRNIQIKAL